MIPLGYIVLLLYIAVLYHGMPFPFPKSRNETTIKELNRLCDLGVLEFQPTSKWASPSFIIPKKDNTCLLYTSDAADD